MTRTAVSANGVRVDSSVATGSHRQNAVPTAARVAGPTTKPDPDAGRCIQLKLDGGRCRGMALNGKQGLCMVHCERTNDDEG